jgi:hypothetical protein
LVNVQFYISFNFDFLQERSKNEEDMPFWNAKPVKVAKKVEVVEYVILVQKNKPAVSCMAVTQSDHTRQFP